MATMTIEVPDKLVAELKRSPEQLSQDVRLAAAIEWFRRGVVSQGKAAELAGIARADFIDELAARKIPVMTVDMDELRAEIGLV